MLGYIYLWKLNFIVKLLAPKKISTHLDGFNTSTIIGPWSVSIIEPYRMLEDIVNCIVLGNCLKNLDNAPSLVKAFRSEVLNNDITQDLQEA